MSCPLKKPAKCESDSRTEGAVSPHNVENNQNVYGKRQSNACQKEMGPEFKTHTNINKSGKSDKETHTPLLKVFQQMSDMNDEKTRLLKKKKQDERKRKQYLSDARKNYNNSDSTSSSTDDGNEQYMTPQQQQKERLDKMAAMTRQLQNELAETGYRVYKTTNVSKKEIKKTDKGSKTDLKKKKDKGSKTDSECSSVCTIKTCSCKSCALKRLLFADKSILICCIVFVVVAVVLGIVVGTLMHLAKSCPKQRVQGIHDRTSRSPKLEVNARFHDMVASKSAMFDDRKNVERIVPGHNMNGEDGSSFAEGSIGEMSNPDEQSKDKPSSDQSNNPAEKFGDEKKNLALMNFYKKLVETDAKIQNLKKITEYNDDGLKYNFLRSKRSIHPSIHHLLISKEIPERRFRIEARNIKNFDDDINDSRTNSEVKHVSDTYNITDAERENLKKFNLIYPNYEMLESFNLLRASNLTSHVQKRKLNNSEGPKGIVYENKEITFEYKRAPERKSKCSHVHHTEDKQHEKQLKHPYYKHSQRLDEFLDLMGDKRLWEILSEPFQEEFRHFNKCKHFKDDNKHNVVVFSHNSEKKDNVTPGRNLEDVSKILTEMRLKESDNKGNKNEKQLVKNEIEDIQKAAEFISVKTIQPRINDENLNTEFTTPYLANLFGMTSHMPQNNGSFLPTSNKMHEEKPNLRHLLETDNDDEEFLSYDDENEVFEAEQANSRKRRRFEDEKDVTLKSKQLQGWTRLPNTPKNPFYSITNPNWKGPLPLYPDEVNAMPVVKPEIITDISVSHNADLTKVDAFGEEEFIDEYVNVNDDKLSNMAQAYSDYGVLEEKKNFKSDKNPALKKQSQEELRVKMEADGCFESKCKKCPGIGAVVKEGPKMKVEFEPDSLMSKIIDALKKRVCVDSIGHSSCEPGKSKDSDAKCDCKHKKKPCKCKSGIFGKNCPKKCKSKHICHLKDDSSKMNCSNPPEPGPEIPVLTDQPDPAKFRGTKRILLSVADDFDDKADEDLVEPNLQYEIDAAATAKVLNDATTLGNETNSDMVSINSEAFMDILNRTGITFKNYTEPKVKTKREIGDSHNVTNSDNNDAESNFSIMPFLTNENETRIRNTDAGQANSTQPDGIGELLSLMANWFQALNALSNKTQNPDEGGSSSADGVNDSSKSSSSSINITTLKKKSYLEALKSELYSIYDAYEPEAMVDNINHKSRVKRSIDESSSYPLTPFDTKFHTTKTVLASPPTVVKTENPYRISSTIEIDMVQKSLIDKASNYKEDSKVVKKEAPDDEISWNYDDYVNSPDMIMLSEVKEPMVFNRSIVQDLCNPKRPSCAGYMYRTSVEKLKKIFGVKEKPNFSTKCDDKTCVRAVGGKRIVSENVKQTTYSYGDGIQPIFTPNPKNEIHHPEARSDYNYRISRTLMSYDESDYLNSESNTKNLKQKLDELFELIDMNNKTYVEDKTIKIYKQNEKRSELEVNSTGDLSWNNDDHVDVDDKLKRMKREIVKRSVPVVESGGDISWNADYDDDYGVTLDSFESNLYDEGPKVLDKKVIKKCKQGEPGCKKCKGKEMCCKCKLICWIKNKIEKLKNALSCKKKKPCWKAEQNVRGYIGSRDALNNENFDSKLEEKDNLGFKTRGLLSFDEDSTTSAAAPSDDCECEEKPKKKEKKCKKKKKKKKPKCEEDKLDKKYKCKKCKCKLKCLLEKLKNIFGCKKKQNLTPESMCNFTTNSENLNKKFFVLNLKEKDSSGFKSRGLLSFDEETITTETSTTGELRNATPLPTITLALGKTKADEEKKAENKTVVKRSVSETDSADVPWNDDEYSDDYGASLQSIQIEPNSNTDRQIQGKEALENTKKEEQKCEPAPKCEPPPKCKDKQPNTYIPKPKCKPKPPPPPELEPVKCAKKVHHKPCNGPCPGKVVKICERPYKKHKFKNWVGHRLKKLKKLMKMKINITTTCGMVQNTKTTVKRKARDVTEQWYHTTTTRPVEKENVETGSLQQDSRPSAAEISFSELTSNMLEVCRQASEAIQEPTRNIHAREDKNKSDPSDLLMMNLVKMMTELVDVQVHEKSCLKLPHDLREFLSHLTAPSRPTTESPKPNETGEGMDEDQNRSNVTEGPPEALANLQAIKTKYLESLDSLEELRKEFSQMPDGDKKKMTGVGEYLDDEIKIIRGILATPIMGANYADIASRLKRRVNEKIQRRNIDPSRRRLKRKAQKYIKVFGKKRTRSTAAVDGFLVTDLQKVKRDDANITEPTFSGTSERSTEPHTVTEKHDEKSDAGRKDGINSESKDDQLSDIGRKGRNLQDVYYRAVSEANKKGSTMKGSVLAVNFQDDGFDHARVYTVPM